MRLQRAICVSDDPAVRGQVEAALTAAGLTVDHADAIDGLQPPGDDVALVVVDRAARLAAGEALRSIAVPVVVVGDDLDDDDLIALMHDAPVSHLVEDPCDRDLGITSEKLASGDLFGLEKYVAAGAPVGERVVSCDVDRRHAVGEVCAWAESNGARRAVLHRIANAVDELLMNAWYDDGRRAVLRWASDDRTLAISVGDGHGALSQRDVIDHVRRARHDRGRPQPASDGGAGIGLYLVLANVASLVVNVERGRRTEVVCLFDRGLRSAGVRSLHVFASA